MASRLAGEPSSVCPDDGEPAVSFVDRPHALHHPASGMACVRFGGLLPVRSGTAFRGHAKRGRPDEAVFGIRRRDCVDQATKGTWGMSWRSKAMKGVEGCDKLGGAVKQALIPRSLNYCHVNT